MAFGTARRFVGGFARASAAVTALLLVVSGGAAHAEGATCSNAQKPRLNVVVEGVRSDRGDIVVELYPNDQSRFLAHLGRVERVRQKAQRAVTSACIVAPAAGKYAVVLYHDENDDEVFNRSKIGLPSEGFGFSNNVMPLFRAPSLHSVLITVPEGETTVRVRMRYLITDRN